MEIGLRVETQDETIEVKTTPWVIMLWERKYSRKSSKMNEDGLGLEDLAYLAYESGKQSGTIVHKTFELFAKDLKNLEITEGDTADPTQAEPSGD
jgi:hypothetical protein